MINLKHNVKRFLEKVLLNNTEISGSKLSFAQCGEDIIIDYVFQLRGILKPTYLDIGANNPYFLNNTAIFYNRGSKGINVEANPDLLEAFKWERPNDINICAGVAAASGEASFYILNDHTLSTFSFSEATEQVNKYGRELIKTIDIQLTTLNEIVNIYAGGIFPDLLTIDVEGMDFDILRAVDFSVSKPKIICAETADYSPVGAGSKREDFIQLIKDKGYYLYADTNLNSVFVENQFWFI